MKRHGMTIPLEGVPILEQRDWIQELDSLGYTDLFLPVHTRALAPVA